jgi:flagellar biosynthetic protein FliO
MAFPFIRTVGGVGLVLSLIVAATLAFRKYAPQYFVKRPAERALRLIETLSMGEKRSVALVQVGGQQYLVGNTPHQISLLAVLRESAQPAEQTGVEPGSVTSSSKKSGLLKLYRSEKRKSRRKATGASMLPADIRGKMQELRQALER